MKVEARLGEATPGVAPDLRHPHAYLALRPTADLGAKLGVEVDWIPVTLAPLRSPSEPGPDEDRGVRHRRHRAKAIAREVTVYAEAQGLEIREIHRDGDASGANLGWLWLRERRPDALLDYMEHVFAGYWSLRLDAASLEPAADWIGSRLGEGDRFRGWARESGAAALESLAAEVREFGLQQSPAYLVDDQVFYGRQHLRMIEWILSGREGRGPI